jgi:hypothetical protein
MRVLVADRNARLLESISRTFAQQFSIQAATTHEHCNELLLRGEFDLAVISEKLADGPGLRLLGQIARNSPDTLRIFAARRSRLQLLKGKLGPFGLFRTLTYPIDPQKLLSALTLARAGLEIEVPGPEARHVPVVERRAVGVPARGGNAASPLPAQHAGGSGHASAAVRSTAERISLTSADAMFAVNVPGAIASLRRVRRSNLPSAPQPARTTLQSSRASLAVENAHDRAPGGSAPRQEAPASGERSVAATQSAPAQAAVVRSAAPPRVPPQGEIPQPAPARRRAVNRGVGSQVVSRSSEWARARRAPMRTKVALGATVVVVFIVTLTLNMVDTGVHVTHAAPRPELERPAISISPQSSTPVDLPHAFRPVPSVAQRVEPRPAATDGEPVNPQIAASTAPVADPSTFGSEAYEPVYSN